MLSIRTRRLVFYGLIAFFLPVGICIALYAQGWRLDLETFAVKKVGAIYLRSAPVDVQIYLDGKAVRNKSGFFQSGTLINDLFPKEYVLRLEKEGYKSWQRRAVVKTAMVTDVKYAALIPEEATPIVTGRDAQDFWMIEQKPLLLSQKGELALEDQILPGNQLIGKDDSGNNVLTRDTKTGTYFHTELGNATSTNVQAFAKKNNLRLPRDVDFVLDITNGKQILLESSSSLSLLNLESAKLITLATSTGTSSRPIISSVAVSRSWIAWSIYSAKKESSEIFFYDKFFGAKKTVMLAGKTTAMEWANDTIGIIQDGKQFYYHSPNSESPKYLTGEVSTFKFNGDASSVIVAGRDRVEIFPLRNQDEREHWQIHLPGADKISSIAWYRNGRNAFIGIDGKTALLEFADSSLENFSVVAPTEKTFYDPKENFVFYLKDGSVFRIDFSKD